jgi:hypothetical protein
MTAEIVKLLIDLDPGMVQKEDRGYLPPSIAYSVLESPA